MKPKLGDVYICMSNHTPFVLIKKLKGRDWLVQWTTESKPYESQTMETDIDKEDIYIGNMKYPLVRLYVSLYEN